MGKPVGVCLTFVGVQESRLLSAGYITAAMIFGAWIWWYLGAQSGIDYYTGIWIEKSLSMDNVLVISLSVTFGLIAGGVLVSLWKTRAEPAPTIRLI